ncbi:hypothetical protein ACROYT_G014548 [Oculina patagonica]
MFTQRCLKFASFNVEGLRNKMEDPSFTSEISKYDFVTLVETWLPTDEQVNFDGYISFSLYRKKNPRAKRASGGITLLIKEHLYQGVKIYKCEDDKFLWWKLDRSFFGLSDDIFVCSVYLPPYTSSTQLLGKNNDRLDCFTTLQNQLLDFSKKGKIILCGDFNARTGHLDDFAEDFSWDSGCNLGVSVNDHIKHRSNKDHKVNKFGSHLIELCHGFKLRILNGRAKGDRLGDFTCFTPNGVSSIDYAIVSEELLTEIIGFVVSPLTDWSCHCLISFVLKSGVHMKPEKTSISPLNPLPMSFKWNEIAKTKFLGEMLSQKVSDRIEKLSTTWLKDDACDVDSAVKDFSDVIFTVAHSTLTAKLGCVGRKNSKLPKRKKRKWFDKSCFELKKEVLRLGNLTSKFPSDPFLRGRFFDVKKTFKKMVKSKKRLFKEALLQKIANFESNNPKEYWEMVNDLRQQSAQQTTDAVNADEWLDYFKKLSSPTITSKSEFEKLVDFNVSRIADFGKVNDPILDDEISLEEIHKASVKLKTGKAAGNDSISNEMIKSSIFILGPALKILFNKVLNSGIFPQLWSVGYISPVFKAGFSTSPRDIYAHKCRLLQEQPSFIELQISISIKEGCLMRYLLDDFHNIHSVWLPGNNMKLSLATHMPSNLLDVYQDVPAIPLHCDKKKGHTVVTFDWKCAPKTCRKGFDQSSKREGVGVCHAAQPSDQPPIKALQHQQLQGAMSGMSLSCGNVAYPDWLRSHDNHKRFEALVVLFHQYIRGPSELAVFRHEAHNIIELKEKENELLVNQLEELKAELAAKKTKNKHDNNYVKDEVTKNDRNLTSATVTRICGSCKIARKIIEQFDTECGIKERSGEHVKKSDAQE